MRDRVIEEIGDVGVGPFCVLRVVIWVSKVAN